MWTNQRLNHKSVTVYCSPTQLQPLTNYRVNDVLMFVNNGVYQTKTSIHKWDIWFHKLFVADLLPENAHYRYHSIVHPSCLINSSPTIDCWFHYSVRFLSTACKNCESHVQEHFLVRETEWLHICQIWGLTLVLLPWFFISTRHCSVTTIHIRSSDAKLFGHSFNRFSCFFFWEEGFWN